MIDLYTPRIAIRPGCSVMTVLIQDGGDDRLFSLPPDTDIDLEKPIPPHVYTYTPSPREVVEVFTDLGRKVKRA